MKAYGIMGVIKGGVKIIYLLPGLSKKVVLGSYAFPGEIVEQFDVQRVKPMRKAARCGGGKKKR